ncbi:MAG TPA: ISL3 family transposase [Kribbella sp.]
MWPVLVDLEVLLPHLGGLCVDGVECGTDSVTISARPRAAGAICPRCQNCSARVHSRYVRRLSDRALGGCPVTILLAVRRFFCGNPDCEAATFAEQIDGLSARYCRRTVPTLALLEQVGLALAGRAGARLAAKLGVRIHRSTLLRLVRALPEPEITAAPTVLGVDDFSLRRGHIYGTILVDMDTGKPIDLLEGREAEPLAQWLRDHPGAQVICRDRAGAYAEGATTGAPQAIQVADRWHLWHNLAGHAEKMVARHRSCWKSDPNENVDGGAAEPEPPDEPMPEPAETRLVSRTRKRFAAVQDLRRDGTSLSAICRILSIDRKTVQRFARADTVDDLLGKATARRSVLDPFKSYLHQRWIAGVTDAAALAKEITVQGYIGSEQTVRRYLQQFRGMITAPPAPSTAPKVRQVTGWLLRRPSDLDTDEQEKLTDIRSRCAHLDSLVAHVKGFAEMMTQRTGENLRNWLSTVEADDQPELHSFALGIRRDLRAVTAGLTLPHSSGKVEGNVNRLKAIKRQMYGRAKLDLLRKLVIFG